MQATVDGPDGVKFLFDHIKLPPKNILDNALCAEYEPEMFFPKIGESDIYAKRICGMCPVREECLEWALENNELHGIFGGTSVKGREKIRRQRREQQQ